MERGAGNVVSVEFAVLYHWHAALSAADSDWMEQMIHSNLPELKHLDEMTPQLFGKIVAQEGEKLKSTHPKNWTFNGLERNAQGKFNDEDLGKVIKDCIDEPAHAFGAHGTPASLKVVDILGQLQARNIFKVCTLNESVSNRLWIDWSMGADQSTDFENISIYNHTTISCSGVKTMKPLEMPSYCMGTLTTWSKSEQCVSR